MAGIGVSTRNRKSETKKICKPLLERQRRARINRYLAELKTLVLDTGKTRSEEKHQCKLEKADILELTVQHLHRVQNQDTAKCFEEVERSTKNKFQSGYAECVKDVTSFVSSLEGVSFDLMSRITDHMNKCLSSFSGDEGMTSSNVSSTVPDLSASSIRKEDSISSLGIDCSSSDVFNNNVTLPLEKSQPILSGNRRPSIFTLDDRVLPVDQPCCSSTPLNLAFRPLEEEQQLGSSVIKLDDTCNCDSGFASHPELSQSSSFTDRSTSNRFSVIRRASSSTVVMSDVWRPW
ncbi:uncharacterized protein LOC143237121 [Tachypleus tridentatus]|uniref:uncharacterized protein LOC143237121 n=1 Tax=Tachypleus tridentatus TaxID=6853 RepID=UPI003FD10E90